ncbi:MAG TPA: ABC transporter ATP-binding protein [Rhodanobacteraceae bacterium]|nr:ABC transporter ATP-binding protein [Rhodanobacteraceae bacterium]
MPRVMDMAERDILLSANDVAVSFGALHVLRGLDFSVRAGELVGVVGPNGAGKTTLFSILVGALRPDSGTVSFEGAEITGLSMPKRCRRGLVRTHQVPRPFNGMTVFENVLVAAANGGEGYRDAAQQRALEALSFTDMLRQSNRLAESLGLLDRKRLELSRALATDPKVLLLDEIGGGLTEGESARLLDMILALNAHGISIVWVEHVVPLLTRAVARLVCLHQGTIIADGSPGEVMTDPAVAEAYLGLGGRT